MFFSYELVKRAYDSLINLDSSIGKSRKEKVSGLRYLFAVSRLLRRTNSKTINLAVGSELRKDFITAVGDIVALNEQGLYTKDFGGELETGTDYGVGSNFLTTRLANSRSQDVPYPGRPESLLLLKKESVSIFGNVKQTLVNSYGVGKIKPGLCVWLLRNDEFNATAEKVDVKELHRFIETKLSETYTEDVATAIIPTVDEIKKFLKDFDSNIFVQQKPDFSKVANNLSAQPSESIVLPARILSNDLPDNDPVFNVVQQLLTRGTKGVLFLGPPGTSKTWYALKVALKIVEGDENRIERVQFHPSFTYEDFIEGLVSTSSISGTDPLFKPKDKVFLNLCEKARVDTDNLYILIIDEFTRGDASKIFGELLTYIEPDYREIKFRLPYSEKEISIPQNLVIFATLNPYDRSVVDLDAAMERRFDVVELLPNIDTLKSFLQQSNVDGERLGKIIGFFNTANKLSLHGFGHTYFKGVAKEPDFILLWNHKLKFIFEKMFRFKKDAYDEVRQAYIGIISDEHKNNIL